MPVFSDDGIRDTGFVLSEANFHRSRDNIIIASGSGVVKAGTLLGKVTASGKFKPSPATGATGEETAVALPLYTVDATDADVPVAAITRQAEVKKGFLTYEATVNDDTKKAAKATQLAGVGIIVR